MPRLSGFSEKAKVKADQASLSSLNKATDLYAISNNISDEDVFAGMEEVLTDADRIEVLVKDKLLAKDIEAQQKDKQFVWNQNQWTLGDQTSGIAMTSEEASGRGFVFTTDKTTITGYEGDDKDITIPAKIDGVAVTKIQEFAFKNKGLTSVVIPDSVTEIEFEAFRDNKLKSVTLPNSIKLLGQWVFSYNELESVSIPNSVTKIGGSTFRNNKLKSVSFPSSVEFIGDFSFEGNQLESVTFTDSLTSIQESAFQNNKIKSLIIPDSVEDIKKQAFYKNNLTHVELKGSTKTREGAFSLNGPDGDIVSNIAGLVPGRYKIDAVNGWVKQ